MKSNALFGKGSVATDLRVAAGPRFSAAPWWAAVTGNATADMKVTNLPKQTRPLTGEAQQRTEVS